MPKTELTATEINEKVKKNLGKIKGSSLLEAHGFFMGKVQLVEAGLKGLLIRKYAYTTDQIEKWTLGKVIYILRKRGVRDDFMCLLDELLEYRNSMAHDFLSTNAAGVKMTGEAFFHISMRELYRALVSVETTIQVYDFLSENDCFEIIKKDS